MDTAAFINATHGNATNQQLAIPPAQLDDLARSGLAGTELATLSKAFVSLSCGNDVTRRHMKD